MDKIGKQIDENIDEFVTYHNAFYRGLSKPLA
jgi:hypothetical protein